VNERVIHLKHIEYLIGYLVVVMCPAQCNVLVTDAFLSRASLRSGAIMAKARDASGASVWSSCEAPCGDAASRRAAW
jgi:hypothetical protein